jgi:hypothetical protein
MAHSMAAAGQSMTRAAAAGGWLAARCAAQEILWLLPQAATQEIRRLLPRTAPEDASW